MAGFSTYTSNGVLNQVFSSTPFQVTGRHLALFTSANGLQENTIGNADEVSTNGSNYARINLDMHGGFTSSSSGSITNTQEVDFPIAASDWGTITHTAIVDASAVGTGNIVCWGPLLNPRIIYTGDNIRVPVGAFTITLT